MSFYLENQKRIPSPALRNQVIEISNEQLYGCGVSSVEAE